jgi:hypothetical protein
VATTPEPSPFIDNEERAAVHLIVEELDELHPMRAAFKSGTVGTLKLLVLTLNEDTRRRLRDVHREAVEREIARKHKPG